MKKTVSWIKENIKDIVQCGECGSLNFYRNIYCIDCEIMGPFIDKSWDREQEVKILEESCSDESILYI